MVNWKFPKMRVPQHGWLTKENPSSMDDVGVPQFQETSKPCQIQVCVCGFSGACFCLHSCLKLMEFDQMLGRFLDVSWQWGGIWPLPLPVCWRRVKIQVVTTSKVAVLVVTDKLSCRGSATKKRSQLDTAKLDTVDEKSKTIYSGLFKLEIARVQQDSGITITIEYVCIYIYI